MGQLRAMKRFLEVGIVIGLIASWSLSYGGASMDGRAAMTPVPSRMITASASAATEAAGEPVPSVVLPLENGLVLRTVPTLSKQLSVGGTMLVPYIGAGFGGGYATELDRSLTSAPSASSGSFNAGQKNLFGPQLIPNEVQVGVRFPF
jgi:hypothetical protein